MHKYIKLTLILLVAAIGISATLAKDKLFEMSKNIEIFINVYKELNSNYVDELDPAELMRTGIDAMVGSLDPYTNYISESQVERYRISDDSKYQGIGASVLRYNDKTYLQAPLEGGPAHGADLRAGDEIISINGEQLSGLEIEDIERNLRGIAGTPVRLKVRKMKTDEVTEVEIERGEVNIPNVPYAGFVNDNIGYINLTTFTANAGANISKELKKLKADNPNIEGVIIDLRYNGGGLLREAIAICNIFVEKGVEVVTTKGKVKEEDRSFKTRATAEDVNIPIAVLVNKRSASASEIVSGVIQDLDRGVVIGQRSFGKGLVQNTFEIGYNNRVKVTTSKYYIPSGRCIQGVEYDNGVPVDIPDDKRSVFKTKNKRPVLDGGGVTPDIKLPEPVKSPFVKALIDRNIIFDYVNQFVMKNDSIVAVADFNFTNYDDFKSFTMSSGFNYNTYGEADFKAFQKALEKEDNNDVGTDLRPAINQLKAQFESLKANDFTTYKAELVNEIEKEIVSRYYFQKGKTQINLRNDSEVDEAIKILQDQPKYKSILKTK